MVQGTLGSDVTSSARPRDAQLAPPPATFIATSKSTCTPPHGHIICHLRPPPLPPPDPSPTLFPQPADGASARARAPPSAASPPQSALALALPTRCSSSSVYGFVYGSTYLVKGGREGEGEGEGGGGSEGWSRV